MGLETAAIVVGGIAAAAEISKGGFEYEAAQQQEKGINLQAKEMALQTQQKTLENYDTMEKVLNAQVAHMTVSGTALSSPSFNAIQRNTLNIGAKKQANIDVEGDLEQENADIEKQNVKNSLYAQLFGDVGATASSAFSIASKMPTKGV